MKTHSGAKKRFRKTAGGKLRGRHAFRTHILGKKSSRRKRKLARPLEVSRADRHEVRELLAGKGRK
jgi:large subunit ribosomal protein L35